MVDISLSFSVSPNDVIDGVLLITRAVLMEAGFVLLHSDDGGDGDGEGGEKLKLNLNVLLAMVDLNNQIVFYMM